MKAPSYQTSGGKFRWKRNTVRVLSRTEAEIIAASRRKEAEKSGGCKHHKQQR